MMVILGRLCASGFKFNAPDYNFGLKDNPYLGYVITREILKPNPKKVQGVIYFVQPNTKTEVQGLINMVQYYRNLCPRLSHILAPLTEEVNGLISRKYFGRVL